MSAPAVNNDAAIAKYERLLGDGGRVMRAGAPGFLTTMVLRQLAGYGLAFEAKTQRVPSYAIPPALRAHLQDMATVTFFSVRAPGRTPSRWTAKQRAGSKLFEGTDFIRSGEGWNLTVVHPR